jgi:hypothetical protein
MGRASRETPVRLGEKLLQIRPALGLSQDGMLRRLGLDEDYGRQSFSYYRAGMATVTLRHCHRGLEVSGGCDARSSKWGRANSTNMNSLRSRVRQVGSGPESHTAAPSQIFCLTTRHFNEL